jgi:hypothetical protein
MDITTLYCRLTHPQDPELEQRRLLFADLPGIRLAELPELPVLPTDATPLLVISRRDAKVITQAGELFFHPGMALLRLGACLQGRTDRYVEICGLTPGSRVLDLTLGLGADALLAAWAVGDTGQVTALEKVPLIHALTRDGLQNLRHLEPQGTSGLKQKTWAELVRAAGRIETCCLDHTEFLRTQATGSFDVVCLDPMFRRPVAASEAMGKLRWFAGCEPLSAVTIREACRVARRRVVLKERRGSGEFARLGFRELPGNGRTAYGVILTP